MFICVYVHSRACAIPCTDLGKKSELNACPNLCRARVFLPLTRSRMKQSVITELVTCSHKRIMNKEVLLGCNYQLNLVGRTERTGKEGEEVNKPKEEGGGENKPDLKDKQKTEGFVADVIKATNCNLLSE